jgi:DNA-directed RNA polymerase II subunit RPB2
MPFSHQSGIVPDLIINPNAFPKRMTVGHALDCLCSKLAALSGQIYDGSGFMPQNFDTVGDILQNQYGMHRHGNEILYNGNTGQMIEADIFFGPTYYMRLKHMVRDKINHRERGTRTSMTRQPTKGRSMGGGMKIGEMERDCVVAYGLTNFLRESYMERSDGVNKRGEPYRVGLDHTDGSIVTIDGKKGYVSGMANDRMHNEVIPWPNVGALQIPYSFKLMVQELEAHSISVKIRTDKDKIDDEEYYHYDGFLPEGVNESGDDEEDDE